MEGGGMLAMENFPATGESSKSMEGEDALQRSTKEIEATGEDRSYCQMLKGIGGEKRASMDPSGNDGEPKVKRRPEIEVIEHQRGKWKIPEFVFSDEEKKRLRRPLEKSLIVKLLGKTLVWPTMVKIIQDLWAKVGVVTVTGLRNDFYLVTFSDEEDYNLAITGGPWMIFDHYLTLREWCPNFDPMCATIDEVIAWIRFTDLPLEYYEKDVLECFGNYIGKTVKVDMSTHQRVRGSYARIAVQVDLNKPLLPKYVIEGKDWAIEYEGMHLLCYACGRVGHLERECPSRMRGGEDGCDGQDDQEMQEPMLGTWSAVQKNRGRRMDGEVNADGGVVLEGNNGSRFRGLMQEKDKGENEYGEGGRVSVEGNHMDRPRQNVEEVNNVLSEGKVNLGLKRKAKTSDEAKGGVEKLNGKIGGDGTGKKDGITSKQTRDKTWKDEGVEGKEVGATKGREVLKEIETNEVGASPIITFMKGLVTFGSCRVTSSTCGCGCGCGCGCEDFRFPTSCERYRRN